MIPAFQSEDHSSNLGRSIYPFSIISLNLERLSDTCLQIWGPQFESRKVHQSFFNYFTQFRKITTLNSKSDNLGTNLKGCTTIFFHSLWMSYSLWITHSKCFKPVQTCSNLSKVVKTCHKHLNIGKFMYFPLTFNHLFWYHWFCLD